MRGLLVAYTVSCTSSLSGDSWNGPVLHGPEGSALVCHIDFGTGERQREIKRENYAEEGGNPFLHILGKWAHISGRTKVSKSSGAGLLLLLTSSAPSTSGQAGWGNNLIWCGNNLIWWGNNLI